MVEHSFRKAEVVGSTPTIGYGQRVILPKGCCTMMVDEFDAKEQFVEANT